MTVSPGLCESIAFWRSSDEAVFVPSTAVTTSPAFSPALCAGVPPRTRDRAHRVRGDREPDARIVARVALDLRVDADHLSQGVQQRAAGVPVVDGGVRLDRVVDREARLRLHLPMESAHDSAGDGLLESKGAPDRDHAVADLELARVAERERVEHRRGCVHADDREVGRSVAAHEVARIGLSVPELDLDRLCVGDDMLIGDDVALVVVDEARAFGLLLLCGAAAAERCCLGARDGDLDHAAVGATVDRVHRERRRAGGRLRVRDRDLMDDGLRASVG